MYDENLFMDCVDTKLFDDFRKKGLNFFVLPVKIHQNFFNEVTAKIFKNTGVVFKFELKIHCIILDLVGLKREWVGIFGSLDGVLFMD